MSDKYIQYGCGFSSPVEWRNFDASPTLYFERLPIIGKLYTKNEVRFHSNIEFGNIVNGLPVGHNSCKGVYCSHVLEHLSLEDFKKALINTYNILEYGGTFRLVLPDLEYFIKKYVEDNSSSAAIKFLKSTSLGKEKRIYGLKGLLSSLLGSSEHLWMWDYKSIAEQLSNSGFKNIRRAYFGDSSDVVFNTVENESRWVNGLGLECVK